MSQRINVMTRLTADWHQLFTCWPSLEEHPVVNALKALGVRELSFQRARSEDGETCTNVVSLVPGAGVAVDAGWIVRVGALCEQLGPDLDRELIDIAGPAGGGEDCRHLVAGGEVLVHVQLGFKDRTWIESTVAIPQDRRFEVVSRA